MRPKKQPAAPAPLSNRILASLSRKAPESIQNLEPVVLRFGMVLCEPGEDIKHVYFLDDALVSVLWVSSEGKTVEIGLVGHEGMIGVPAILGGVMPYRAVVHMGGRALRMKRRHIKEEFRTNQQLQELLLRYTNGFLIQVAQSSICNCYHRLQERLCRWLLVASDAARSDVLKITHDLIGNLLCSRRASITVAAGLLQRAGLIRIGRAEMTILDRRGLEAMACECYGILRDRMGELQS